MSFVCVLPNTIEKANENYKIAWQIYKAKREAIRDRIKVEYDVSGEEFVDTIQAKLTENIQEKITSPDSRRAVSYNTILEHLYSAVEKKVEETIEGSKLQITNDIEKIQQIQQQAITQGKNAQRIAMKEINDLVQQYANDLQLNNIINKYLPNFISKENTKLSLAQVFGYAKSIFKREITKRINGIEATRIFRRHPSIILGYIQEDAAADAGKKAIEHFSMSTAKSQTVGAEQSKIDILISLTKEASLAADTKKLLKPLLSSLDSMNQNFTVNGKSNLETNEFLGIQSKPWKLSLPTTRNNQNSVGSRVALLKEFLQNYSPDGANSQYSWHAGVFYLSTKIEDVIGANTVMYVTNGTISWTDDILNQMMKQNKYFAFMMNANNKLTSHVQIADHYG